MSRKLLAALFICNLMPILVGSSLLPLLPVYAQQLGADATVTGIYLGLSFGTLAVGTFISGWLSDRFNRRKIWIVLGSVAGFISLLLMGHVTQVWQLIVLTMIIWFTGGVTTSTINILTGMHAPPRERGRVFGIIALTMGIGQLAGGLFGGRVVDAWGYGTLCTLVALTQLVLLVVSYRIDDKPVVNTHSNSAPRSAFPTALWVMMLVSILISTLNLSGGMGLSLSMDGLGFDATAISGTSAVGGLVTLPLPFLIGWLSDRFDRKWLLAACYTGTLLGTLVLANASLVWHFWLVQILFSVVLSSMGVGQALITDLVPHDVLGSALARYNGAYWVGGVIGYTSIGFVIQNLGLKTTFSVAAFLPVLAILIILLKIKRPPLALPLAATQALE